MSMMATHRAAWGGTQVAEWNPGCSNRGIPREPGSFLLAIGVSGV
jgi:hypothetical protein